MSALAPALTCGSLVSSKYASTRYESLSIRAITGISVGLRACPIVNLNGGRHPGREDDARRYLVDMDAHRNALRQAHPGEDRVDISHPLIVGLRVRDVDRAGDAVDAAAHDLTMAHQLNLGPIAHADGSKIRLLEISVNPE